MRSLPLSLSLLSLSLPYGVFASPELLLDCASDRDKPECQLPMKPVTTVTPGAYYVAKIPCPDCKVPEFSGPSENQTFKLVERDNDLFFNISLTRNHRTLLLNSAPIFPSLLTTPHPSLISTSQIPPNFTLSNLATTLACARRCRDTYPCACIPSALSTPTLDFDHNAKWLTSAPSTQTEKWEVTFDAIGAMNDGDTASYRGFTSPEQLVLRIIMQGKEIDDELQPDGRNQGASPLTGPYTEPETIYEYEIASIEFSQRYADVPVAEGLSLWGSVRRFFGGDIVRGDGHTVYLAVEWGSWGKLGSLRQGLGVVLHEWRWDIVFSVLGGVALAVSCLYFSWWLFFAVKRQRELARWDGMDQVWARMRRGGGGEEGAGAEAEAGLLSGGYRDEVGYRDGSRDEGYRDEIEGAPPSYEDEVQMNKPLPDKPLPDKPLPAVPLIEA